MSAQPRADHEVGIVRTGTQKPSRQLTVRVPPPVRRGRRSGAR